MPAPFLVSLITVCGGLIGAFLGYRTKSIRMARTAVIGGFVGVLVGAIQKGGWGEAAVVFDQRLWFFSSALVGFIVGRIALYLSRL